MASDRVTIELNSKEYRLLSELSAQKLSKRSWHVESKKQATTVMPTMFARSDVRQGDIPDEYVISWRRFDKGIAGNHEDLPGTTYITEDCNGFTGSLRPNAASTSIAQTTNAEGADPAIVIVFNQIVFHIRGRYAYRYADGVETQDRDFGAGVFATDAIVHNSELVVAFGGTTTYLQKRNTSATWSTDDDVVADYLAHVEDRLWRATATNAVSNIGPTDNPFTIGNWSAGITVGEASLTITDLNGYGERLVVSKQEGMFIGDRGAIFPNVLPQFINLPDTDNGKNTLTRGADIFYPHARGLIRYNGFSSEEVGIQYHFPNADTTDRLPSTRVNSLSVEGDYLWAACSLSGYGRANPTGFQKTTDGTTYTNYTTQVTDNDLTTEAVLDSLSVLTNNDWFIVGYSTAFYGVLLEITAITAANNAVMIAQYWNGSAWTAMPNGCAYTDRTVDTSLSTTYAAPFTRSGYITWINSGLGSWAASTINSINAFWIRFSLSSNDFDTKTRVGECRVLTQEPRGWLYRGRPQQPGDVRTESIIWESHGPIPSTPYPVILVTSDKSPHNRGRQIQVAGKQISTFFRLPPNDIETSGMDQASGFAIVPKHDGGMPFVNKQWTQLNIKGRTIDSDRDVALAYRTSESSSFTTVSASITSSPSSNALSSVTGYSIQPRVTFNAFGNDVFSEVQEIEAVFRALWTYKESYTFVIEVGLEEYNLDGGSLPDPDVQLTNLEALRGSTVTLIDPFRRNLTVTVFEISEAELFQTEQNQPAMAFQVRAVQV